MPGKGGQWYAKTGGPFVPGLQYASDEVKRVAMNALESGAADILAASQALVPILDPADQSNGRVSGELRESARLIRDDERLRVALAYESRYAAYIHEHLDFKHPTGGQAKYLETAITAGREALLEHIATALRATLEG